MADSPLFANNIRTTLAAAITAASTVFSVADATGMPTPDIYEYFVITVKELETGAVEIMYVVGRSGNELTVLRAQEGTVALPFGVGAEVAMPITAGLLEYLRDL